MSAALFALLALAVIAGLWIGALLLDCFGDFSDWED